MQIAFIRQVEEALTQLTLLADRASDEDSQFKHRILMARDSILHVSHTYHEVLARDISEDEAYQPPLKEIK